MPDPILKRRIDSARKRLQHRDYDFISHIIEANMCEECLDEWSICNDGVVLPDCEYGCHEKIAKLFTIIASKPVDLDCDDPECDHGMEQS